MEEPGFELRSDHQACAVTTVVDCVPANTPQAARGQGEEQVSVPENWLGQDGCSLRQLFSKIHCEES